MGLTVKRAVGQQCIYLVNCYIGVHHNFDLSPTEFGTAISSSFLQVFAGCDGCGDKFTFQHALECRKGGLVTQRHNEVKDALGDLASREPVVQEADLGIREFGSHRLKHWLNSSC